MEIGVNLFGLRDILPGKTDYVLSELKAYGSSHVEPVFYLEEDADSFSSFPGLIDCIWSDKDLLEKLHILKENDQEIKNCHYFVPLGQFINSKIERLIDISEKSGIKTFVISSMFSTMEECKKHIKAVTEAANEFSRHGIKLLYHNHEMEFTMITDGDEEISLLDYFLKEVPSTVKLQADAGWILFAGVDEVEFIKSHIDRIDSIHLKDFAADFSIENREKDIVGVGEGCLKLKEIINIARRNPDKIKTVIIDQDISPGDMMTDVRLGIESCKKI